MPATHLLGMAHLVLLALWGGVVATEAVIELYAVRHHELHTSTIRLHYWIDLLVELPLIIGVAASGTWLAVRLWPLSVTHFVKIGCVMVPLAANLACIAFVLRRKGRLDAEATDAELWQHTRRIIACAGVDMRVAGRPLATEGQRPVQVQQQAAAPRPAGHGLCVATPHHRRHCWCGRGLRPARRELRAERDVECR
ncbi:MAG: hypothetical protein HY906_16465 [Deltaproteobacteria bacterium]|nr:hypothetical protein [Deltaproteobacteria bacterium]